MKYIFFKYFLLLLLLSALSSCRIFNPSEMFRTGRNFHFDEFQSTIKEYIIRPFDKMKMTVYTNKGFQLVDMEKKIQMNQYLPEYLIDRNGMVKLPVLGKIKVSGLTVEQAEKKIEKQYAQFFKDPFVLINITNRRVFVFSDGSEKGDVITMDNNDFTLIEALARVGGMTGFAKAYRIKLIRGDLSDPKVFLLDISSIEDLRKNNLVLQANDIIYVEARPKYAFRFVNELSPYLSLLTSILLIYSLFTK